MSTRSRGQIRPKESPLFWPAYLKDDTLFVLDETLLPVKMTYVPVRDTAGAVEVIRQMRTRAFGQFLVVLSAFLLELERLRGVPAREIVEQMHRSAEALNASRPTFPFAEVTGQVTRWADEALLQGADPSAAVGGRIHGYLAQIRSRRHGRVRKIAAVLRDGDSVLTHCNVSGELAMAFALCRERNKHVQFFATETRPFFQGSKLTVWELQRMGADVTLIADNAAGSLMADGLVNKVIVGSDRNCANGDFANKIGTYQLAVLAKEFRIPLYVLTQPSARIPAGRDIPVEMRPEEELLTFAGRRLVEGKVRGFYPGFDVVPVEYVRKGIALDVH